jgi:hypothetical protein
VELEAEEVVLIGVGAGGSVDEEFDAGGKDQGGLFSVEMAVHVFL